MSARGKYIVLEGPEGVGKTTQILELTRRLQAAGLPVRTLREPDSQSDLTARALRQLTQDPRYPMNTNTEVLLYNAARSQSLQVIKKSVEQGIICVVDRNYLTTLAVQYYGRGDVPDYETINRIISFAVNGVEPDLCIVLDAPVQVLKERAQHRGQGERFDNLDETFLERVRAGYLWEAKQRNLPVVFATDDEETIANNIWSHVAKTLAIREPSQAAAVEPVSIKEIIAEKQHNRTAATATDYVVPDGLSKEITKQYRHTIQSILDKHAKLLQGLSTPEAQAAATLVLPVAAHSEGTRLLAESDNTELAKLAKEQLQETHNADAPQQVELVDFWPRSELHIVPSALYPHSNLSLRQLTSQVDRWPYEQKVAAFNSATASALEAISYTWDLAAAYQTILELQAYEGVRITHQSLTPRYGYEVPQAIEDAGLADTYMECFDASLELYSQLQAAGYEAQAQYATLLGHKLRVTLAMRAATVATLKPEPDTSLGKLANELRATIAEVHPLIADNI